MAAIDKIHTTDKKADEGQEATYLQSTTDTDVGIGTDDVAAIPRGEVDPVYEAKARVLNRAASIEFESEYKPDFCSKTDRDLRSKISEWDGINGLRLLSWLFSNAIHSLTVQKAALHRRGLRMGL